MTARATVVRRVFGGAVAVAAAGVLAAPLFKPPVAALRDSFPADGAVLAVAPGELRIDLTTPARRDDVHMGLVDQRGDPVTLGPVRVSGTDVLAALPADLARGRYVVSYHVGFGSGGELAGTSAFAIGSGETTDKAGGAGGHAHGGIDPLSGAALTADVLVLAGLAAVEIRRRRRPA